MSIAEELAFRGFLLRRLISSNFESVSFRQFSMFAFLVSSVAFRVMHRDRWFAGTGAGFLYAGVLLWRGRIGDAMVAHATTNALITAWVLFSSAWTCGKASRRLPWYFSSGLSALNLYHAVTRWRKSAYFHRNGLAVFPYSRM